MKAKAKSQSNHESFEMSIVPPPVRGHNWTGSLVKANAKDLKHPEYINGRISGYYIFFGIVTALNVTYDPNKLNGIWGAPPSDELIVDWIGLENGHS